jgi:hypothetical protein
MRNWKADTKALCDEYEELYDAYQAARDRDFHEAFTDFMQAIEPEETITEDLVRGFLESFTFPDKAEWYTSECISHIDDYYEQKYEEQKDERVGL